MEREIINSYYPQGTARGNWLSFSMKKVCKLTLRLLIKRTFRG